MFKEVAQFTGKLPFAGKHLVKKWFLDGISDARHGETSGKILNTVALLGFAALHARQLDMGISELQHDVGQHSAEVGVDALYATANSLAIYTQVYLAAKILRTPERQTQDVAYADVDRSVSHRLDMVTATELAVTLGGQMLFMATMS